MKLERFIYDMNRIQNNFLFIDGKIHSGLIYERWGVGEENYTSIFYPALSDTWEYSYYNTTVFEWMNLYLKADEIFEYNMSEEFNPIRIQFSEASLLDFNSSYDELKKYVIRITNKK